MFKTYVTLKTSSKGMVLEDLITYLKKKKITLKLAKKEVMDGNSFATIKFCEEYLPLIEVFLKRKGAEFEVINKSGAGRIVSFIKKKLFLIITIFLMLFKVYYDLSFLREIHISGNKYLSIDSLLITLRENSVYEGTKCLR